MSLPKMFQLTWKCVETEGGGSDNLDLPLEALIKHTVVSVDVLACAYIACDHLKSFTLQISISFSSVYTCILVSGVTSAIC